ncbi:hypothetical protein [Mycolicibacterium vaccae]|uniref:Integral membrane protein n=1 Tax=Mycolicibacterium vaccae ATCC 25954 TaxID=1194972 RepID=K0UA83_MYCVA|nr:hypothetical protein [Mycolicibacterium vaccae]ANI40507.1 membrane protein [Mycolicibacterium vaccae 95051]EJZ04282.1 hypothetical protein MVAC_29508 [Mycolicibacterium vaccae ATCC 25954]MCV7059783.1 hypothetical protein [Mycolicibacterium vaccae]
MPSTTEQRVAAERWFLQRGLPAVLRPGVLVQRVWTRSAPALAGLAVVVLFSILIVAATGEHTIDIDGSPTRTEWFVIAVVLLVLPTVAVTGRLVSLSADPRLRGAVSTVSLGIAAVGVFYGGPSSRVLIDLVTEIVLVVLIFVCTATGIGAILGWAVRMTLANLASVGNLLLGALPVMLLTVLVFFNGPVWTMAAAISRPRLWLALTFLILIAVAFLSSSTWSRVQPILSPEAKVPGDAVQLSGTPFESMPDRPRRVPLSKAERLNVAFVLTMSQIVQVLTVAVVTGLLFLVFGLILISPELLSALAPGSPTDGRVLGMTLPVPQALIHVTMFLTALTFMYLAARAVADKDYRAQFLDPLLEDLRFTLVARDRYRTATASG